MVNHAGFRAEGLNGFLRGRKLTADAMHMRVPARLDHRPVRLIAVHGDGHAAAAGSDLAVEIRVIQGGKNVFQFLHILQRGGGGHVAAVQQNVAADALYALLLGFLQHRNQVRNVGVHVAVGQQTDEVQGCAIVLQVADEVLPRIRGVNLAGFDGFVDELGALRVNLTAAERVVADFGVAHIVIGGQTDCRAVRLDDLPRAGFLEFVEGRGRGLFDHVAQFFRGFAYAVHDDENNRLFHCSKILLKKYSTGENLVGWDGCPSPPHRIVYFFTDVKGQGRLKGINTREKR